MEGITTICVSTVLRDRLVSLGRKNESYEDTLKRVCPKLKTEEEIKSGGV